MKKIALIPAYEPDDNLINLLKELKNTDFDVVVVNDGSLASYNNIFREVSIYARLIEYKSNKGKGYALKRGIKDIASRYKDYVIVTMDCDGQHTVRDAMKISDVAVKNKDMLILGKRIRNNNTPLRSRIGNEITKFIYFLVTGINIYDTQTGLRAFTNNLTDYMLSIDGDRYEYEMNMLLNLKKNNIKVKEVEIETIYIDNNSKSHFNTIKDSLRIYKNIFKFASSSLISFLIDYVLYVLFLIVFNNIILSNVLARLISATVNYNINRVVVFKDKNSIYNSLYKYIILALFILIINTCFLKILVVYIGFNKLLAKVLVEVILFILSYIIQRRVVFKS